MTPEQAALCRVHEAVAQANLCMPPLSTIIVATDDAATILAALDAAQAAVTKWETTLSAVMPADFKDWHANSRAEWPEMAAWVIQNLREREAAAQAPREAQRLTDLQVADCVTGLRPYPMDLVTVDADQLLAFSRAIESRVRELCGVAP